MHFVVFRQAVAIVIYWLAAAPSTPRIAIFSVVTSTGQTGGYKAGRHGDLLHAVGRIGNHAAAYRATNLLTPQPLTVGGVEDDHCANSSRAQGYKDNHHHIDPSAHAVSYSLDVTW
jgi:hypothetical protein